jgi:nucleoid DNA-binding protein
MTFSTFIQSIEQLLFTHDCVIIPQFGGFVVNQQGYTYDAQEAKIHPKKRWVAFNERLNSDDGILAMHIAKEFSLSQKKAFEQVIKFSADMKASLQGQGTLEFGNLGVFSLTNEQKISFSPNSQLNFDLTQFGLYEVGTEGKFKPTLIENPIPQSVEDQPAISQENYEEEITQKAFGSRFYAYVLTAFIIGGFGAYMLTEPNSKFVNGSFSPLSLKFKMAKELPSLQPKGVVKAETLPVVAKPVAKLPDVLPAPKAESISGICLVVGSFQTQEKAANCVAEFVSKGFDLVEILPKKEGEHFFRVSIGTSNTMDEAYQKAAELKKTKKLDIWVYQINHYER